MIYVDGSLGEGGGQILRSSLAMSLLTGKPFKIKNIRANRNRPGLMRQHLTSVKAALEVGNGMCEDACMGASSLSFYPGRTGSGNYHFKIGSAGSATLVLQTVLPALMVADGGSEVVLEGGTHNPFAPPFNFLSKSFVPLLNKMGADVALRLENYGFYPAGGGRFTAVIKPSVKLRPLCLENRGAILNLSAEAIASKIPGRICRRELAVAGMKLNIDGEKLSLREVKNSPGPGNVISVEIESAAVTEVFTGFGMKGVRAEKVAGRVVQEARKYLSSGAPVGPHLADQILIPFAMAGGGSFVTCTPSGHTKTNMNIVEKFLDVTFTEKEIQPGLFKIRIMKRQKRGCCGVE